MLVVDKQYSAEIPWVNYKFKNISRYLFSVISAFGLIVSVQGQYLTKMRLKAIDDYSPKNISKIISSKKEFEENRHEIMIKLFSALKGKM